MHYIYIISLSHKYFSSLLLVVVAYWGIDIVFQRRASYAAAATAAGTAAVTPQPTTHS